MIRYVSIALVIWGLIAQPLMAAMPAQMMDDNIHSSMASDVETTGHGHNIDDQTVEDSVKAHCREKGTDESSKHCSDCGDNCAKGLCASLCITGSGVAAFQETPTTLDLKESIARTSNTGARSEGSPSLIFHPPKHS